MYTFKSNQFHMKKKTLFDTKQNISLTFEV